MNYDINEDSPDGFTFSDSSGQNLVGLLHRGQNPFWVVQAPEGVAPSMGGMRDVYIHSHEELVEMLYGADIYVNELKPFRFI